MTKTRTPENEDLILALKVAYKFSRHFGSDMSDAVNTIITRTLGEYGEKVVDHKADALLDSEYQERR